MRVGLLHWLRRSVPVAMVLLYAAVAGSFAVLNQPGNAREERANLAVILARTEDGPGLSAGAQAAPQLAVAASVQAPLYYSLLRPLASVVRGRPPAVQYRALRFVSVILHCLTLWLVFLCAGRLFGRHDAAVWGAMAFFALNPKFGFVGGTVTNDVLANLLVTAVIYLGLSIMQGEPTLWRILGLGIAGGLAWVTKVNAFLPTLLIVFHLWERKRLESLFLFLSFGLMLCIAAPTFFGNLMRHGDPLGLSAIAAGSPGASGFQGLWRGLIETYEGFWGNFGISRLPLPQAARAGLWVLGGIGGAGILGALIQRRSASDPVHRLAGGLVGLILVQALALDLVTGRRDGSSLFIGAGVIAPALVLGMRHWISRLPWAPARHGAWAALFLFGLFLCFAGLGIVARQSPVVPSLPAALLS